MDIASELYIYEFTLFIGIMSLSSDTTHLKVIIYKINMSHIKLVNTFQTETVPNELVSLITGRSESLFAEDLEKNQQTIFSCINKARILVIGASGSIGSAFVKQLMTYQPLALFLIDINENSLADLVRDLRSCTFQVPAEFETSVVGMGGEGFEYLLKTHGPFDCVLNFSALKHVRSEREPYGLMRLLDTNVFSFDKMLDALSSQDHACKVFSVSSDKAVNPVSLMGGSKRWMEKLLTIKSNSLTCTSARFANVAYSAGSLPQSFMHRISSCQALAGPNDIKRYFISHEEAGQLCLLALVLGQNHEVFIPRLSVKEAISFVDVAIRTLEFHDFEPKFYDNEEEAKYSKLLIDPSQKKWPCYFSPSNTSGEKEIEELSYPDEDVDSHQFKAVNVVIMKKGNKKQLDEAKQIIHRVRSRFPWSKKDIITGIRTAVPELKNKKKQLSLDDKM